VPSGKELKGGTVALSKVQVPIGAFPLEVTTKVIVAGALPEFAIPIGMEDWPPPAVLGKLKAAVDPVGGGAKFCGTAP
jgi:hypothetical protein